MGYVSRTQQGQGVKTVPISALPSSTYSLILRALALPGVSCCGSEETFSQFPVQPQPTVARRRGLLGMEFFEAHVTRERRITRVSNLGL